jgi:hypothetical protein
MKRFTPSFSFTRTSGFLKIKFKIIKIQNSKRKSQIGGIYKEKISEVSSEIYNNGGGNYAQHGKC